MFSYRNPAGSIASLINPISPLKVARLKTTFHLNDTSNKFGRERVNVFEYSTDIIGVGVVGGRGGNGGRDKEGGEQSLRELHLQGMGAAFALVGAVSGRLWRLSVFVYRLLICLIGNTASKRRGTRPLL